MWPGAHATQSGLRPRKRTYNLRLIRREFSYTIHEAAELFSLHPNSVRRWVKAGLRTIDDRKPHLIHGTDLIAFVSNRQQGRKRQCGSDQMYCCRCRAPRRPAGGRVVVDRVNARQLIIRGVCEFCGVRINRGGSLAGLSEIERVFTVAAAPARLGETTVPVVMCQLPQGA